MLNLPYVRAIVFLYMPSKAVSARLEYERRREEFISTASHELKTPLASLKGYAQILKNILKVEAAKYYLSKINDQIDRLSQLVDDLLDVSKIQSGQLRLRKEKFDIIKLINEAAMDIQLFSNTHKIIVKGLPQKIIFADKGRIGEVLSNLLSNAVKFSPKANKVIVETQLNNQDVLISVTDSGIGIFDKNLQKIFEPFFQGSNKIRQSFAGLGLGLYKSLQIIKRHEGRIWAKSQKGEGTTFYVSLPQKG